VLPWAENIPFEPDPGNAGVGMSSPGIVDDPVFYFERI